MFRGIILVTGADSGYFDLLQGLLLSLHAQSYLRQQLDIAILDLGLTEIQKVWLKDYVDHIKDPGWDYPIPNPPGNYFKAMTARPHLPKHFPGYEFYFWMDADAWLQDPQALELYLTGAKEYGFAITPEVDRGYRQVYGNQDLFLHWQFYGLSKGFGEKTAISMYYQPILNSGVFAAKREAPHWNHWANALGQGVLQTTEFYIEQTSLNYAIYQHRLETAYLPAWCNWVCNRALPLCSEDGKTLYEPCLPYHPLGIIHLTSSAKQGTRPIKVVKSQKVITRSLRYQ